MRLVREGYFPMQNVKFIDNQWVTRHVVQMWFKFFGNNFHVAGTKTDLDSLQWDLRKLAQARFQRYEKWRKPPSGKSLFLVKRESIIAASSESVSTQYSQPITALIRDCTYRYSQYNISSTFGYTIPVLVTLCFFWLEFFCRNRGLHSNSQSWNIDWGILAEEIHRCKGIVQTALCVKSLIICNLLNTIVNLRDKIRKGLWKDTLCTKQ